MKVTKRIEECILEEVNKALPKSDAELYCERLENLVKSLGEKLNTELTIRFHDFMYDAEDHHPELLELTRNLTPSFPIPWTVWRTEVWRKAHDEKTRRERRAENITRAICIKLELGEAKYADLAKIIEEEIAD